MLALAPPGLPELNDSSAQVITLLLRGGPMARSQLARRLGMTPAALTKITRPMLEIGLLQQVKPISRGTSGRRPVPLRVRGSWADFAGIKITGDTSHAVLTDLGGAVLHRTRQTLRGTSVNDVVATIVSQIDELRTFDDPVGVGVSLAGPVLPESGQVVASPFLGWRSVSLGTLLTQALDRPVAVENDLRALTGAMHWFDDTLSSFALVTFGAGIGCGLVLQNRLVTGHGGAAGLIDHLRISDQGPLCERGHRGCASGFATTSGIVGAVGPASAENLAGVAELARTGHRRALLALEQAGYAVGCVIGTICNVAGPARVILSGEGVELFEDLQDAVHRGIGDVLHPALPSIPLIVRKLTFSDWAQGSAVVAIRRHISDRTR